jgi:hypothetical protein
MAELHSDLIRGGVMAAVTAASVFGLFIMSRSKNAANRNAAPILSLPGPERSFLIGNLTNFPLKDHAVKFAELREKLG